MTGILLKGAAFTTHAAAPHLPAMATARLSTSSICPRSCRSRISLRTRPGRQGVLNLTKAWRIELAPHVRVNAVAPGPVLPPPNYTAKADSGRRWHVRCWVGGAARRMWRRRSFSWRGRTSLRGS